MDKAEREKWRKECVARLSGFDPVWARNSIDGILIRAIDHIDALEQQTQIIRELAAPTYSDEKVFALTEYHQGSDWPRNRLHAFGIRAKAAIAAAPEPIYPTDDPITIRKPGIYMVNGAKVIFDPN